MSVVLEQFKVPGLAQLSYLVGDSSAGLAAVIDPRRDVQIYIERARELGLRITHAIETHIHADFVSGTRQLHAAVGAKVCGGRSDDYEFELQQLEDGDSLPLGKLRLEVLSTPGHTPEHVSLLLFDREQGDEPVAVFTGDTLFNLDVGRPDLVGDDGGTSNARELFHSIFDKLVPLGDRLEVYPGHGAGSSCGKSIGDRDQTTIGNERRFSEALKDRSESEFVDWILQGMPEPPSFYFYLKKVNARGAPLLGTCVVPPAPLSPEQFAQAMKDCMVLDTRSMLAFGGGHVPGALNIPLRPQFATWVGWMVDPEQELLLVVESERDVMEVAEALFRIGFDRVRGYLHSGMPSWQNEARPLASVEQWTVRELERRRHDLDLTILDVRSPAEWESGHVPGAVHHFVPHLEEHLEELRRDQPLAVYCGTGYRATIGASLLKRHGFERVINIPGSWKAWQAADLPVQEREPASRR